MLSSCLTFAAEPASFIYIATGAASFAIAGLRKSRKTTSEPSTFMLLSKRTARDSLKSLDLL